MDDPNHNQINMKNYSFRRLSAAGVLLFTQAKLFDDGAVALDVFLFQVIEHLATLTNKTHKSTLGDLILFMLLHELGKMLDAIKTGVAEGLRKLPGRPMGIMGDDSHRIDQSGGLNPDSAGVEPAPILLRRCKDNVIRLHILMFGGGPAIRAKTYRVFHKHNTQVVLEEIVKWATEGVAQLGCSPCTLAVGVGRSHFEATSMMLQAQVDGSYDEQSEMEAEITRRVNEANIGPLGLRGDTSVIATFMKVGPQRASGVRIVCVRPTCCFEPRIATVELGD